jgi:hypothetical protein
MFLFEVLIELEFMFVLDYHLIVRFYEKYVFWQYLHRFLFDLLENITVGLVLVSGFD